MQLPKGISETFLKTVALGVGQIGLDHRHIETYSTLPLLHRDPFDGIIVATAIVENMTIITTDENIQKYDVPWIW
ncbi:MAG: PIN domain-containing protein [Defluviitaleaceae bacterium]|nr:PIN domain-containing protein [Defluviitaleaceae bacterium]MCL2255159.1 PIN domain-containing protein [Lachnospiraceae bacterium]